jgi:hypothetical protein
VSTFVIAGALTLSPYGMVDLLSATRSGFFIPVDHFLDNNIHHLLPAWASYPAPW